MVKFLIVQLHLPSSLLECWKRSKVDIVERSKYLVEYSNSTDSSSSLEGMRKLIFVCIAYRSCRGLKFHPRLCNGRSNHQAQKFS